MLRHNGIGDDVFVVGQCCFAQAIPITLLFSGSYSKLLCTCLKGTCFV